PGDAEDRAQHEDDDGDYPGRRQRPDDEPRDQAADTAGDRRAADASENRAQYRGDHEYEREADHEQAFQVRPPLVATLRTTRRRQRFALDHADHALDAGGDPAVDVVLTKARRDGLVDDALGDGIRHDAFEPILGFDAKLPVLERNQ